MLPNIKYVEYTHGQSEFGADFILITENSTLSREEYIGVIAKSKQIKQPDVHEIDRQITECLKISRNIHNGEKKIFLNSVWVITSQTFTQNAKDAISALMTYRAQLIDAEEIVVLLDRYYPDYWEGLSVEVLSMIQKTQAKANEEDRRHCLIPNLDPSFFIEPEIVSYQECVYFKKPPKIKVEKINIYDTIQREKFILLEAPMGYGKSKLLRHLVRYFTEASVYKQNKVMPIYLKYSELFVDGCFQTSLISASCSMSENEISRHNKILFLIDGFDEISETIEEKLSRIEEMALFLNSSIKYSIILATRGLKGLSEKSISGNCIKKCDIKSLSFGKLMLFLEKLCVSLNLKDRILEDLKQSPLMKELPQSPIAAILLARLFESNAADLPSNMPELYGMYLELILGKWDVDKGLESLKEFEVVQSVLYLIAQEYIENKQDYLTIAKYNDIINAYLNKRNLNVNLLKIDKIICDRSGLLVKDEGNGLIFYSHRTFIEYIYAKHLAIHSRLHIDAKAFDLAWSNIYYFYIGIKKDCEEYLKELTDLQPRNEAESWLKILNLSNFYLAALTTPYSFFEENLSKIFLEAASLYKTTSDKTNQSLLSKLPKLVLLWWMQFLLKEGYGYDFFKKTLENTTLLIDESQLPEEVKIIALFFLSSVGFKMSNNEPACFLFSKYKDKLPSDIIIGLKHEIGNNVLNMSEMKKYDKWLERKIRRMNRGLINKMMQ